MPKVIIDGAEYVPRAEVPELTDERLKKCLCDNKKCCNPRHLEAITRKQNHSDAVDRGGIKLRYGPDSLSTSINEELAHAICKMRTSEGIGAIRYPRSLGFPCVPLREYCKVKLGDR